VAVDGAGSVFVVPKEFVKALSGEAHDRVLVLNSVARVVIESVRGQDPEFVFVYQRVTKSGQVYQHHAVETMNNTGWQKARLRAVLPDVCVHHLRHTYATRLRAAGVAAETRSELLWHVKAGMAQRYAVAYIRELQAAAERVTDRSIAEELTVANVLQMAQQRRVSGAKSPKSHPEVKRARGITPLTL
jgi:integrase